MEAPPVAEALENAPSMFYDDEGSWFWLIFGILAIALMLTAIISSAIDSPTDSQRQQHCLDLHGTVHLDDANVYSGCTFGTNP